MAKKNIQKEVKNTNENNEDNNYSKIKEELTKYIDNKIENQPKNEVDLDEIKEELTDYVDNKMTKHFSSEIDKYSKMVIRDKSRKIFFKNVIIIFLLAVICFLVFLLYKSEFFDKYLSHNNNQSKEVISTNDNNNNNGEEENKEKNKKEEIKAPTLEELKEKYSKYLDLVYINENSEYITNYYEGSLTKELKSYLAFNLFDLNSISKEDMYSIINVEDIGKSYNILFSESYTPISFKYNQVDINYLTQLNNFISLKDITKAKSNIVREIIDIKDNEESYSISTVEGLIIDESLYNVVTKEEIEEYNNDNVVNYKDRLTKLKYTFDKNNKLLNIEKI